MIIKKILKEEFINLKELFPGNEELWIKYKNQRLKQFDNEEIDIYVIEEDEKFIGELTVNYVSHDLKSETIPNIRVYFEAFRIDKKYQGKGLGQKLIEYTINDLKEFIKNKENYVFVGVKDEKIIAFLYVYGMLRPDGKSMFYIHSVDVISE